MDRYTAVQAGKFTAVSGKVIVKLGDIEYVAAENEFIPQGAIIEAFDNAIFQVQFNNGEIRSNTSQSSDSLSLLPIEQDTDIQQIQAIIAAGGDPTTEFPETAAGGNTENSGGFDVSVLERSAGETVASTLFDSVGFDVPSFSTFTEAADAVNVAPVIFEPNPEAVDEAGVDSNNTPIAGIDTVSGELTASDADNAPNELSWSLESEQNQYGVFVLDNVSGGWSFELNNDATVVQALQEDESVELRYIVRVRDGQGGVNETTVTITVTGTNDAPIVTGESFTGNVDEAGVDANNAIDNGTPSATGQLTATDVDNVQGDLSWTLQSEQSAYGTFSVDATTGEWTFTIDNNASVVQSLQDTDDVDLTYTVRVSDGLGGFAETTVTITVTGTNDAPIVTGESFTGNVDEAGVDASNIIDNGTSSATGQLTASDVDNVQGDLSWTLQTEQSAYGTFSVDATTGEWTFILDNNANVVQSLQDTDSFELDYVVRVSDGLGGFAETTVTITVTGTNDAPIVTGENFTGNVDEAGVDANNIIDNGTPSATGQLTATDVDNVRGDLSWTLQTAQSAYGTFSVDENTGEWTFILDNNASDVQSLQDTDSFELDYVVRVSDGLGGFAETTVTITVTGTNDAPIITGQVFTGSVTEAGADLDNIATSGTPSATGVLTAADVDNSNDDLAWSLQTTQNAYGTFNVDAATGQWTFTLDNEANIVQSMSRGEHIDLDYVVRVSDGKGGYDEVTVTITVNGTNDLPYVVSSTNAVISEEGLNSADNNFVGIPDDDGIPSDQTDATTASGVINVDDVDSDSLVVSFGESPTFTADGELLNLTSGGQAVQWEWNEATGTLVGFIGTVGSDNYQLVMELTLTPSASSGVGQWVYDVNIHAPIDHPDTNSEDTIVANFQVNVSDQYGNGEPTTISIIIEDDAPEIGDSPIISVTETELLNGSYDLSGNTQRVEQLDLNGFTITAQGFTATNNGDLVDRHIVVTNSGLGIASPEPYHNLDNEISFRYINEGGQIVGKSEAMTITLDEGRLATEVTLSFANMYGSNSGGDDAPEKGIVDFYRDGVLIASIDFTSDASDGNYSQLFNAELDAALADGFDQFVIRATHYNGDYSAEDSSDFSLSGIAFSDVISQAEGQVDFAWGADGAGSISLQGLANQALFTSHGEAVTLTESADGMTATTASGELVFEFSFDTSNGQWQFQQYQNLQSFDNDILNFQVLVTDRDGDNTQGDINIRPSINNAPVAIDDAITVAEDSVFNSVIDLDNNDSDIDGDNLSVIAGTFYTEQGGVIIINSDGSYSYTPPQDYYGEDSVEYTVTDGELTDTATLHITVTPTLDPVVISSGAAVISEEGLQIPGHIGLPDDIGLPEDITDNSNGYGYLSIDNNVDNNQLNVNFTAPSQTYTSNGETVQWHWDGESQSYIGYTGTLNGNDYLEIITVSFTEYQGHQSSTWLYEVNLHQPLDHPNVNAEDVLSLDFGVMLTDANGEVIPAVDSNGNPVDDISVTVSVEDDAPEIGDSPIISVTETELLNGSYDLSGNTQRVEQLDLNGFTITAQGFTATNNGDLVDRHIVVTNSGLGIASPEPYHNLDNEISFRYINEGGQIVGKSEAMTITLDEGRLATEVTLSFANMYGSNSGGDDAPEKGIVDFYRDGVLIASIDFTSDASDGNYSQLFNAELDAALADGFDQFVIRATHYNGDYSAEDSSDFSLSGIAFSDVISQAEGQVDFAWGADGAGSISLQGLANQALFTSHGEAVTLTESADGMTATTASGELVFELSFDTSNGQWQFQQYQNLQSFDNDILNFQVLVTDRDGDNTQGDINIRPSINNAPVAIDDAITVAEDSVFNSVIDLDNNDSDIDGDNLSVIAGTFYTEQGGVIIINSDGSYSYTPPQDYYGEDSVEYTVTDGELTDTATLHITVTPTLDPVVISSGAAVISEEGLQIPGHIGLPDDIGLPEDITDNSNGYGYLSIDNNVDNNQLNVNFTAPSQTYTSNGETVQWHWDGESQSYIGYTGTLNGNDYLEIITVSFTEYQGHQSSTWLYEVNLHQPLDHPNVNAEDVLSLDFGVMLTDANGEVIPAVDSNGNPLDDISVTVSVEDDAPEIGDSPIISVTETELLNGSYDLSGNTQRVEQLDLNGFTITAQGFTATNNGDLVDRHIVVTNSGLGIASPEPYHNLDNEISFRYINEGGQIVGKSEAMTITLDEGRLATEVTLSFANMYGSNSGGDDAPEKGIVDFYRDGVLIASIDFTSDASDGNYSQLFNAELDAALADGFDQFVIRATHYNGDYSAEDSSDFSLSGIAFSDVISQAEGQVDFAWGADGAGSISLQGLANQALFTSHGEAVTLTESADGMTATTASGELVFEFSFDTSNGQWQFQQYQNLQSFDNDILNFQVLVTDRDGDNTQGDINIRPSINNAPVAIDDAITVAEDSVFNSVIDLDNNDSDIDGDNLSVIAGTFYTEQGGVIIINSDGSYSYTPPQDYYGEDSVEYTVTDGELTDTATLHITVTPTLDPVVISSGAAVISEEGLQIPGHIGLPDDIGLPEDITDNSNGYGYLSIDNNVDNNQLNVNFTAPSQTYTSNGETVQWHWDGESQSYIGYTGTLNGNDYLEIITVSFTEYQGHQSSTWLYEVNLHQPLDHPNVNAEDVLSLDFGVMLTDANGEVIPAVDSNGNPVDDISVTVSVEDDAPEIGDSPIISVTETELLNGSYDLSGNTQRVEQLDLNGFTITAQGFTATNNGDLVDRHIVVTNSGLGIASPEPYHNLDNEISFRYINEGGQIVGKSEAMTITLDEGRLATEVTLSFANMYGSNSGGDDAPEKGIVDFYRDGVLIASIDFTSDASDGNYSQLFNAELDAALADGFDQFVIRATHYNGDYSAEDSSDFSLSGIAFSDVISQAEGQVDFAWGADGAGSISLQGLANQALFTSHGDAVTLTESADGITATTASGELVFELSFDTSSGQWQFQQYQNLQSFDNDILNFQVLVTDRDGDNTQGDINIRPDINHAPDINPDDNEITESAIPSNAAYVVDASGKLAWLDIDSGAVHVFADLEQNMTDIALDPQGQLFGVNYGKFYSIDPHTESIEFIADLGKSMNALAFSSEGDLYAAGMDHGQIVRIDPASGESAVFIEDTGFRSAGDLVFHKGELYMSFVDGQQGGLIKINLATQQVDIVISELGDDWQNFGLVSANDGNLYALNGQDILLLDPEAGTYTEFGELHHLNDIWGAANQPRGENSVTGNVLENDSDLDLPADSLLVTAISFADQNVEFQDSVTIEGIFGTLTIDSNGNYEYLLDDDRQATEALTSEDTAFEIFTYTVADSEGAQAQSTLTIQVNGVDDYEFIGSTQTSNSATGDYLSPNLDEILELAFGNDDAESHGSVSLSEAEFNGHSDILLNNVEILTLADGQLGGEAGIIGYSEGFSSQVQTVVETQSSDINPLSPMSSVKEMHDSMRSSEETY